MAPTPENALPNPGPNQDQKTLHVWSKPIEQTDEPTNAGGDKTNKRPTITEAVGMIKSEDFTNIHNTPCARQGFLTGIASGAGVGGLKFVLNGNAIKAANWAVGMFVLGSMASYEYCQYQRRAERIQMKRHIEVVTENKREQARKLAEEKRDQAKSEQARIAAQRPWYKFW